MEPLPVDLFQLQRRDPVAWTDLLARYPETGDAIVTAVTSEPIHGTAFALPRRAPDGHSLSLRRYTLTLAGCSDPITFIAKQTNAAEAMLYRLYGDPPGTALPACRYIHLDGDDSWIILDDVPDHYPPAVWTPAQVDDVIATLARIHAAHWDRDDRELEDWNEAEPIFPHFIHVARRRSSSPADYQAADEQSSAAYLSDHALGHAGRLIPHFRRAAAGLAVMRDLGGWPGVFGRQHFAAAADLLDDPVPMLAPLLDLPVTLLHGAPHPGHWRLTLFDERYLIDWREAQEGPGVLDLMAFIEGYPLLPDPPGASAADEGHLRLRRMTPLFEETLVDTYLLTLAAELGGQRTAARAFRAALPAARCFHVLLTWLPYFYDWAADLPDPVHWQRLCRLDAPERDRHPAAPPAAVCFYLAGVFERFLHAYRNL
jgi:hypothetical protein